MDLINNKKAHLRFTPIEKFSAGLELSGQEVKALRAKLGSLEGSRVVVRGGEAFITGMTIPPFQGANAEKSYEAERPRRLLLTQKELRELAQAESQKGLTIVPFAVYTTKRFIKAQIAIVRGKGKEDKREDLKKKTAQRDADRLLKNR
jgi:SsrA-binding protein